MDQNISSQPSKTEKGPIDYELPKVVESVKQGWTFSYQAIAVVAALFAGMEAGLITLMKSAEPDSHPPLRWSNSRVKNTILALGYVSLISSIGSILSSLMVIDGLGQMTFRNAKETPEAHTKASYSDWEVHANASYLMQPFGVRGNLRRLMYHCVGSLVASGLCALLQICLYIWLHEATSVAATGSVATLVAFLPILIILS